MRLTEFVVLPWILIGLLERLHAWLGILLRRLIGIHRCANGIWSNTRASGDNKLLSCAVNLFLMIEDLVIHIILVEIPLESLLVADDDGFSPLCSAYRLDD